MLKRHSNKRYGRAAYEIRKAADRADNAGPQCTTFGDNRLLDHTIERQRSALLGAVERLAQSSECRVIFHSDAPPPPRAIAAPTDQTLRNHIWQHRQIKKIGGVLRAFIAKWTGYGHKELAETLVRAWIERNRAALK